MKRSLLIALCLGLAVSASPAAAKKGKKPARLGPVVTATAIGSIGTPAAPESTAVATCPAKTQAVGGGFAAPFEPGAAIVVRESFRSSPTTWTVVGRAAVGSGAATATALCRKIPKKAQVTIQTVSQSASVAASFGATASAEATCPSGMKSIGGGFRNEAGSASSDVVIATRNHRTATGWRVTGLNGDSDAPHSITAEAYCAKKIKKLSNPVTSATPALTQTTKATVASPACPLQGGGKKKKKTGKKAVQRLSGGGWDFGDTPIGGPIPVATQSLPVAGTWQVQIGDAVALTGSPQVSVQGVCF